MLAARLILSDMVRRIRPRITISLAPMIVSAIEAMRRESGQTRSAVTERLLLAGLAEVQRDGRRQPRRSSRPRRSRSS